MRLCRRCLLFVFLAVATLATTPTASALSPPRYWAYVDMPLWDLADEGLPVRVTLALPSRRDPLARLLQAEETRWTFSTGYARVYNSYDPATGRLKNYGGHAGLFSGGRQFLWALPRFAGRFTPAATLEVGVNFATRPFPADGTQWNFKLITGLQWKWSTADRATEWTAGVMWPHFSNANLLSRNAGYDGLVVRLGRSF